MESLRLVSDWPVDNASVAVVAPDRVLATFGAPDREFPLASVTKLLTAYATLVAVEEGAITWDQPAGPPGSTVRHLAAHASGLNLSDDRILAAPATRRIYSNTGFDLLADTLTTHTGIPFAQYLQEAVLDPLRMAATRLDGSPASGAISTVEDLARFATELLSPGLVSVDTLTEATHVAFPGLNGVLPGYGQQRPNDWGLGFELRAHKSPHWTGKHSSPDTFGHFGQSGTFLWVDPPARLACITLTDRPFGDWAIEAWPTLTDAILAERSA